MPDCPINELDSKSACETRPMRIGLYLPGMSGSRSGVWTRMRDLTEALLERPTVELFLAVDDIEVASNLGIAPAHWLVFPRLSGLKRAALASRRVRKFATAFDLDLVQVEAPPVPRDAGRPILFSLHDLRSRYTSFWRDPSGGK